MIGFKGFNHDLTCLNFQYEEGQIYELDETENKMEICKWGFHFCLIPYDVLTFNME